MSQNESQRYLESKQQLIIAAKVNWLCETELSQIDPELARAESEVIVNSLDPLLIDKSRVILEMRRDNTETPSSKMVGHTNLGDFSINSTNDDSSSEILLGNQGIYRIGNYVATRITNTRKGYKILSLEHFFGMSGANLALEEYNPHYDITYGIKQLEVRSVIRQEPVLTPILWLGMYVSYKPTYIYKSN